jgi:ankyrin repeat protein
VLAVVSLLAAARGLGAEASGDRLLDAARRGDREAIARLLEERAPATAAEPDGTTALHFMAERGDLESAARLIANGADVRAANRYGVTPLALACLGGHARLVALFLEAGADPNGASPEGETALMTAARTGQPGAVKVLLDRGARVNEREGWRGQTALMWAAGEGHLDAVRMLLDHGAEVDAASPGGMTALLFAARGNHVDVVRALVAAGADLHLATPDGTRALALAIVNAHYDVAAALLALGADPNAPDPRGSALHAVAWMRNPGYAAAPPRVQSGAVDSLSLARALLEGGAKPNARVEWKEIRFDRDLGMVKAPPAISIGRGYLSYVGATPFYIAAKGADLPLMRLLVEHGADARLPTVQHVTPLMAAAGLGFWDGESPGPESGVPESQALEAVKLALALGNDVNAVTDFGPTPIEGDPGVLLHRHPLNLASFPDDALGDMRWGGSTALHGAALRGADSIVAYLVEQGARLDAANALGWTPLTVARGVFVANTAKAWPSTIALLESLERRGTRAPQD